MSNETIELIDIALSGRSSPEDTIIDKQVLRKVLKLLTPEHGECFMIHARTGCTCCARENFFYGPYKTKEEAEQQAKSFASPPSRLSSQYAENGVYDIVTWNFLKIGNTFLISEDRVDITGYNNSSLFAPGIDDDGDYYHIEIPSHRVGY